MFLVDTSVWIELLNGRLGSQVTEDDLLRFVTCGPIVQEVVQGLRDTAEEASFRQAFDAIPRVCDPLPERLFVQAAEIYRLGRRRGLTIRSSADCLIAAISMEAGAPVWHKDRDFAAIARYTPLAAIDRLPA
jgi:hypothetical protein